MQKSLYDQKPAAWERISAQGFPMLARMARFVFSEQHMADELSVTRDAVSKWVLNANGITAMRERQATKWLELSKAARIAAQNAEPPAKADPAPQSGVVLMVACDANTAARVQKVLAMFGCEVVEV